jgi:hypothetical protein
MRHRAVEYIVNLSEVGSWTGLVQAFNEGFMRAIGGDWNGNLDAFDDYLSWPDEQPYRLILRGWHSRAIALVARGPGKTASEWQ